MNLFGKAKNKPQANTDTSATIVKLRETLESLDKRYVEYLPFTLQICKTLRHPAPDICTHSLVETYGQISSISTSQYCENCICTRYRLGMSTRQR